MNEPSRPPLYVDITTMFQERSRHPHGTLRVERCLAAELAAMGRADIRFCRYARTLGRYLVVEPPAIAPLVDTAPPPDPRRAPRSAWRQSPVMSVLRDVESWGRRAIRDPIRRRMASIARRAYVKPDFEPGSTVLLAGELQRHDFSVMLRLRQELQLRFVYMFYDLLGVLAPDDPRRGQADATDLPGTDFVTRTASLILPISRFSADALEAYWRSHGIAGPPVKLIRLGVSLPVGGTDTKPVAGLRPGAFALAVGDIVERKNQMLLLNVWSELLARGVELPALVLAGRIDRSNTRVPGTLDNSPLLREHVHVLSNAGDDELAWLYANCRFTLFPSFSEGFGLPVAESLSVGKVCIASNATAIPEASQGLAIHLDPHDLAAWVRTIERLAHDDVELARCEHTIATQYRSVTWRDTARDVLDAIDALHVSPKMDQR